MSCTVVIRWFLEYNFQIPHFVYCDQAVMIHASWVALWYFYLKKSDVIWWEGVWWRQNTFRFLTDKIHTHWYLLSLDRSNRSALCWLLFFVLCAEILRLAWILSCLWAVNGIKSHQMYEVLPVFSLSKCFVSDFWLQQMLVLRRLFFDSCVIYTKFGDVLSIIFESTQLYTMIRLWWFLDHYYRIEVNIEWLSVV
jgi:hypothetical protein